MKAFRALEEYISRSASGVGKFQLLCGKYLYYAAFTSMESPSWQSNASNGAGFTRDSSRPGIRNVKDALKFGKVSILADDPKGGLNFSPWKIRPQRCSRKTARYGCIDLVFIRKYPSTGCFLAETIKCDFPVPTFSMACSHQKCRYILVSS